MTTAPRPDPLIDEIREIRARLWEEADHDFKRVAEEHQRIAEELHGRIVHKPGDEPQNRSA